MKKQEIKLDNDGFPIPPQNHGEFDNYVWFMKYTNDINYTKKQQIAIVNLYDQYYESIIDYYELKDKIIEVVGIEKISEYNEIGFDGIRFSLKEYYSQDEIEEHIAECTEE